MSLRAFIYKALMIGIISAILLPMLTHLGFVSSLLLGVILALVLYIVGDMFILNRYGNTVATVVDVGTAVVGLLLLSPLFRDNPGATFGDGLVYGIVVGIAEFLFHGYLNTKETASRTRR